MPLAVCIHSVLLNHLSATCVMILDHHDMTKILLNVNLANSEDPDEMPHHAAFNQGILLSPITQM